MAKKDLYQTVTDRIIAQIEAGARGDDWTPPWTGNHRGLPYNATTKRGYNGVNILLLWGHPYPTNQWASYKQWQSKGAQVRKGERGEIIVYCGTRTRENGDGEEETFRFLKYSTVFNAAQVDGWQSPVMIWPNEAEQAVQAEAFVAATGAQIHYGSAHAFYRHSTDEIHCPDWERFQASDKRNATEAAYGTLLHELTHWTGAEHRCDRQFGKRFGDDAYAAEELVAELGAAFLCAELGIAHEPREDHARYIEHWLGILRGDNKAIFTAASKASQAADYLKSLQAAALDRVA